MLIRDVGRVTSCDFADRCFLSDSTAALLWIVALSCDPSLYAILSESGSFALFATLWLCGHIAFRGGASIFFLDFDVVRVSRIWIVSERPHIPTIRHENWSRHDGHELDPPSLSSSGKLRTRRLARRRLESSGRYRRAFFEPLEDRRLLATLAESGTTLTVTLDNPNELFGISDAGSSYSLTSNCAFGDGGIAITAGRTTFSDKSATVTASGLAAYDTIRIVDGAEIQGTRVSFNDSGTNAYADNFDVSLAQDGEVSSGEQSVVFVGSSSFGAAR